MAQPILLKPASDQSAAELAAAPGRPALSVPHGERSPSGSRKLLPLPCWSSAMPRLRTTPHRVGKPLSGPLAGCHGARRGTYRIVYRIDENSRVGHVLDIEHRLDIYHRPQR